MSSDDARYELVRGELEKFPFYGAREGRIAATIIGSIGNFAGIDRLGVVCASGGGFRIESNPDTVLSPAAAFVRADRDLFTEDFFPGPPDVAFEFSARNVRAWLGAGAHAVIVIDSDAQTIHVHRESGATNVTDTLTLEDVIPGWSLPLSEIFE
jgi:Uma2 family endonuclease